MALTIHDLTPISLCIATQELFDAKRYKLNFCDYLLLRARDQKLEPRLVEMKRDLNSILSRERFLDGHKAAIISNIDKIISLVASRCLRADLKVTQEVVANAKELLAKVIHASSFEEIGTLEPDFRRKVTLPVYQLFAREMKFFS